MTAPNLIPEFESNNVNRWYAKGAFKNLDCRLGRFNIFYIDDQANSLSNRQGAKRKDLDTIVLLHGFPTSSYDFDSIWQPLNEKYRLVTLDMLGFGFSEKPNHRNYTIHQQADLVESLVADLELESFHVVAHDYGVSVAQELLARQIDGNGAGQWISCTLLNGGLFPETHRALTIQKIMLSRLGKWLGKLLGMKQFSKSFSRVFGANTQPSSQLLKEFWELISFREGRHLFYNLITYIYDRRQHRSRWVGALQNSNIPLAVINGSADPVSGAHLVTRYQELNCRLDHLRQLATIGHYPHVEAADEVAESILKFLHNQCQD